MRQINLIVGDFFKSKAVDLKYADIATDLITWLRSKTLILNHLTLAVLRAVLTRWTAHYVAFSRLVQLKPSLLSLVYADIAKPDKEKIIVIGNKQAKEKANAMIDVIKNEAFWAAITRYCRCQLTE